MTLVKPVINAIRILNHLSVTGQPETATELARALQINTSTCFNILRTLVSEGVLSLDERSKTYSAGLGIIRLAERTLSKNGKLAVIKPVLREFAEKHHMTVTIWSLHGGDRIMLTFVTENSADLQIQMRVGQRLPLYASAVGRNIAYHTKISKAALRREFNKLRWDVPPTFDEYWADVQAVVNRGWTIDDGNFSRAVTSYSVPIFDDIGHVHHSLVVTMFRGQHKAPTIDGIIKEMKLISTKIGALL